MTDSITEERMNKINNSAQAVLAEWLEAFANGEKNHDDVMSTIYGLSVLSYIFGLNPEILLPDAKAAAERLNNLIETKEYTKVTTQRRNYLVETEESAKHE